MSCMYPYKWKSSGLRGTVTTVAKSATLHIQFTGQDTDGQDIASLDSHVEAPRHAVRRLIFFQVLATGLRAT